MQSVGATRKSAVDVSRSKINLKVLFLCCNFAGQFFSILYTYRCRSENKVLYTSSHLLLKNLVLRRNSRLIVEAAVERADRVLEARRVDRCDGASRALAALLVANFVGGERAILCIRGRRLPTQSKRAYKQRVEWARCKSARSSPRTRLRRVDADVERRGAWRVGERSKAKRRRCRTTAAARLEHLNAQRVIGVFRQPVQRVACFGDLQAAFDIHDNDRASSQSSAYRRLQIASHVDRRVCI